MEVEGGVKTLRYFNAEEKSLLRAGKAFGYRFLEHDKRRKNLKIEEFSHRVHDFQLLYTMRKEDLQILGMFLREPGDQSVVFYVKGPAKN